MTVVDWFLQLFRNERVSVTRELKLLVSPIGTEQLTYTIIKVGQDFVCEIQTDNLDEAILKFMGYYIKTLKERK